MPKIPRAAANEPTPPIPPSLPELFHAAAWLHARSFMAEHGYVPDVMLLGRYADEELMFVFPSSQDRDLFATACTHEAEAFGADIAMIVGEAEWTQEGAPAQPVVRMYARTRDEPMRAEMAFIIEASETTRRGIGPVSGVLGPHHQPILEAVWPGTSVH